MIGNKDQVWRAGDLVLNQGNHYFGPAWYHLWRLGSGKKKWGQICKPWLLEIKNSWKQLELHRFWSFILPQVGEISPILFPQPEPSWDLKWIPISNPNNPQTGFQQLNSSYFLARIWLAPPPPTKEFPSKVWQHLSIKRWPVAVFRWYCWCSEIPNNHLGCIKPCK